MLFLILLNNNFNSNYSKLFKYLYLEVLKFKCNGKTKFEVVTVFGRFCHQSIDRMQLFYCWLRSTSFAFCSFLSLHAFSECFEILSSNMCESCLHIFESFHDVSGNFHFKVIRTWAFRTMRHSFDKGQSLSRIDKRRNNFWKDK